MTDPGLHILNGVMFHGGYFSGDGFTVETNPGWADSPPVRSSTVERDGDGLYDLPVYLGGREFTLNGLCSYRSPESGGNFLDRLRSIPRTPFRFQGDHLGRNLWGTGRKVEHRFQELVPGSLARYSVTVAAADPLLYGEGNEFDGTTVNVFHRGTEPALPIVTVTGTMPSGYTINGPGGRQIRVGRALASGNPHVIDFRTCRLKEGGVVRSGAVTRRQPWAIPVGVPVTAMSLTPVSGSGSMTVRVHDTFA